MRVRKQIPVPELYGDAEQERIWCAWSDCDNPASGLFTITECFAAAGVRSHPELPRRPECSECRRVAFCCTQHAAYYVRSHRPGLYGRLPAGVNGRYL